MKLKEFCDLMETLAPRELACSWDNVGLLVEPDHEEIRKVLLCLDNREEVAREAVELGCDMVLSHHPGFFHGTKQVSYSDPDTRAEAILLRHGIGHFAAHTNLDSATGGVNDTLAKVLGLINIRPLEPENMGRVGELPCPMTLEELCALCKEKLHCTPMATEPGVEKISTLAVLGGGGGGEIASAVAAGADAYLTGEAAHHNILYARSQKMHLILCGHYETEKVVLYSLMERLQMASDDVQYTVTLQEGAPLRAF